MAYVPRQVLTRVAALDDAILPIVLERLGCNARSARVRERAQVADTGVDVQLAVGRDTHETVKATEPGRVIRLADSDSRHLRPLALAAARDALLPVETRGSLVQRIVEIGAGDRPPVRSDLRDRRRGVDLAKLQPVDLQVARRLVHQGLEHARDLVLAGTALRRARRRVGINRHAAPAHRFGVVNDGKRIGGIAKIPKAVVRAAVLHDVHIGREQPAVRAEAELDAALEAVAGGADVILLRTADAHHDGLVELPGQQRRDGHARKCRALGAEAAAAELGNVVQLVGLDADVLG